MYRGVRYDGRLKTWVAFIQVNRHYQVIGEFENPADAAKAYDQRATELLGQYATLNFPKATPDETSPIREQSICTGR